MSHSFIRASALALTAVLFPVGAQAQISFTDATAESEIIYVGESYGASWGYVNDDLLPDLFVSHHRDDAGLYMNLGNGSFEDRAFEVDVWQNIPRADHHGAAFGDFNNDGFSDLLITAGSAYNSQFLVNNGSFMSDQVANFTFDVKTWGGRMPAWFDFTNDGFLDLLVGNSGGQAKFQTHEQVDNDFVKRNFHTGQNCINNNYGQLSDLNNDGTTEWICSRHDFHPDKIYDYSSGMPWIDRTNIMPTTTSVVDSVFADFNGDLLMDMFAVRGRARISGTEQTGSKTVETHLINFNGEATGFTMKTTGDVSFVLHTRERNAAHVYIGAGGKTAPYPGPETPINFTLSPSDPSNHGIITNYDSVPSDIGVFIGYNPGTQTWTFLDWSDSSSVLSYTYGYISSTANITNLTQQNLHTLDGPKPPALLRQTGSGFVDGTNAAGLGTPIKCVSVAAADFDNDMDLDLYVACRNAVSNAANMVLENDGNGHFTPVPNAGGAAGPTGFHVGLSETVVVSDYDVDGFVDVFVTNGLKLYPELIGYTDGGPDKVFRNNGNSNRWIELDLEGVTSNRDGLGAIVTVTAGGVQQRREQGGGYHRWAQNDTRLHFGLASNTTANIHVRWPNGTVDMYNNVAANGLYTIVQGGPITRETNLDPYVPPPCPQTALEPEYDVAVDREMFIWQTACQSNTWSVRVTGGAGPQITYTGRVETDQAPASVVPVGLEFPWDELDTNGNPTIVDYKMIVGDARRDGFDITLAPGTSACFGVNSNITTAYAGENRIPVTLPFDLATGGPCNGGSGGLKPALSIANASVDEDDGVLNFTVSLSGVAEGPVNFTASTADGTATVADNDYTALVNAARSIPAGQLSTTVSVALGADSKYEPDENFTVNIALSNANAVLGDSAATGTIVNDEPEPVSIAISDVAVDENVSNHNARFFVTLNRSSADTVTVNYVTQSGSATASSDFRPQSGTLTFVPGVKSRAVDVFIYDDSEEEQTEQFTVVLSNAQNALIAVASGTGTINDDDLQTRIIELTNWTGATGGVSTNGNQIVYSGSPTGWAENTVNSVPLSSLGFSNDYEVNFTIDANPSGDNWVIGLGRNESGPDRTDVDYGFRNVNGNLQIRQNGGWQSSGPALSQGDVLSIKVIAGGTIEFHHEGVLIFTSSYNGQPNFYVDSSFKNGAISISVDVADLAAAPPPGPFTAITGWVDAAGGVSNNSNTVSYSGSPGGWGNNTINSVPLSQSGLDDDYIVSWRVANDAGGNWAVGLGSSETEANWRDIEFAWRTINGSLKIYESGNWRANANGVSPGDVLAISVSGNTIQYLKNGSVVRTVNDPGNDSYYIDTSFKDGAVTLSDFEIGEL